MEANGDSTLLSRLVFRRTKDQERMATHYSEELQRTTAGKDVESSIEKAHPQITVTRMMDHRPY